MFSIAAVTQLLSLFDRVREAEARGEQVWARVKAVLPAGDEASDTSALDEVIADATRRRAIAQREAGDVVGPVTTGSIGE